MSIWTILFLPPHKVSCVLLGSAPSPKPHPHKHISVRYITQISLSLLDNALVPPYTLPCLFLVFFYGIVFHECMIFQSWHILHYTLATCPSLTRFHALLMFFDCIGKALSTMHVTWYGNFAPSQSHLYVVYYGHNFFFFFFFICGNMCSSVLVMILFVFWEIKYGYDFWVTLWTFCQDAVKDGLHWECIIGVAFGV